MGARSPSWLCLLLARAGLIGRVLHLEEKAPQRQEASELVHPQARRDRLDFRSHVPRVLARRHRSNPLPFTQSGQTIPTAALSSNIPA